MIHEQCEDAEQVQVVDKQAQDEQVRPVEKQVDDEHIDGEQVENERDESHYHEAGLGAGWLEIWPTDQVAHA